jgi:integrase
LALGSPLTAEERLRVLGRYCELQGTTPQALVALGRNPDGGRRAIEDQLMDFVARLRAQAKSPGYVENYVKAVKGWLLFNEVALVRRIRVGDTRQTPTLEGERIPTKAELHGALAVASERGKVILALCAFSGLRPEVLGNKHGTDGLRLGDLPDLEVREGRASFNRFPARVAVRRELSKVRRPYFTFLPDQGCRYLASYLEKRMAGGEVLGPDSPVVRVELRRERHGRPAGTPVHGSTHLVTSAITKEIRRALWTQVKMRPYVLRSYFATNLEMAERNGKMTQGDRKFFMGRAGDIDRRYTTGKARLPPEVIEEMRKAYAASQGYLVTEEPGARGPRRRIWKSRELFDETPVEALSRLTKEGRLRGILQAAEDYDTASPLG